MEQTNFIMFRYSIINFLILLYKNILQKSMKNLKFVTALFLCFSLFSGSSCRKEKDNKDALPPETHQGLNTFGCLVNNELFRESGSLSFGLSNPNTDIRDNILTVVTSHGITGGQQIISFGLRNFTGIGKYYTSAGYENRNYNIYDIDCNYKSDSSDNSGFVDITYYNPAKKIVSGTFSFNVKFYNPYTVPSSCDSSDIIITDGRFDLTYYKWN